MQIIDGKEEIEYTGKTALAIGKFDGIHLGHRKLIEEMKKEVGTDGVTIVFTFGYNSSAAFMRGGQKILTQNEKRALFEELGIDILVEYNLDENAAAMPPEDFIEQILCKRLHAQVIVAGTDVSFGYKGAGNAHTLEKESRIHGYSFKIIDKIIYDEDIVSSTRIRECLQTGRMEIVQQMLGRPYFISGIVKHGRGIGTRQEVPTANLIADCGKLLPPYGVYFSRTNVNGEQFLSITNIGLNPTFGDREQVSIETNILTGHHTLYDQQICVELLHFWRPERAFQSAEELKMQIEKDIQARTDFKD